MLMTAIKIKNIPLAVKHPVIYLFFPPVCTNVPISDGLGRFCACICLGQKPLWIRCTNGGDSKQVIRSRNSTLSSVRTVFTVFLRAFIAAFLLCYAS